MRIGFGRRLSVGLISAVLLGFVFFAAADDPTTDIVIVCPNSVSAGQNVTGYATEYTPAIILTASTSSGMPLNNLAYNPPFGSAPYYFCYATREPMIGQMVMIIAHDSNGQVGTAACLVTP